MLAPSKIVKKVAKTALSQNFLSAIAAASVLIFAIFAASLTASLIHVFAGMMGYSIALTVMIIFVIGPLCLGVINFLRRMLWEQKDDVMLIFKYFSDLAVYKRAVHFVLSLGIRLVTIAFVVFLPCVVVRILSSEQLYTALDIALPIWTANLWALNSFLVIIATMAAVFITLKYYLSVFVFVSNDELDVAEAINMSTIISKRTGADFFGLVASFIGWFLTCVFVLPLVVVLPYFLMSYCTHCRFAITAYNKDVDAFNAKSTPSFSVDEI